MSSNDSCSEPSADCGQGEISIFGSCHKIGQIPGNQNYTIFNSVRDTAKRIQSVLGIQNDYSLPECMTYCKNTSNCGAMHFEYTTDPKGDIDYNTKGTCKIGEYAINIPGSVGVQAKNGHCAQFYSAQNADPNNGINIVTNGGNNYYIDRDGERKDQYALIQTDYGGVDCRKRMLTTTSPDNFSAELMGDYCKDHQDLETCIDFCKNSDTSKYCTWNLWYKDTDTLKSIASFFLTFFLFLYFYRFSPSITPVLIIFIPILIYIIIRTLLLIFKKRTGTKEFNNGLKKATSNCTDTSCPNNTSGCSDFLGDCDCPYTGT